MDLDDLCNSFALSANCSETPDDEYEFMENMLNTLKCDFKPDYIDECAKTITRYTHVFLTEIHNSANDFNYTSEIKIMADRFIKNWTIFDKNKSRASAEDTVFLRNSLIEFFSTLKLSIDERLGTVRENTSENTSEEENNGDVSDHENYDMLD